MAEGHEEKREEDRGAYEEEAGTEIAPTRPENLRDKGDAGGENAEGRAERFQEWSGLGWGGLILSILSLLFLPFLLGTAGMMMGYLAYRRGAHGLGLWAMVVGAVSIVGSFLFSRYF